jgi:hypothetical protein
MPKKLTTKQKAFVYEYLVDFNATAAALRAGYKGGRATLSNIGTTNLSNPAIRHAINALIEEWAIPASEVLRRLSEHARGSMADFVSEDPAGQVHIDLAKAYRSGAMDNVRYLVLDEYYRQGIRTRRRIDISLYDSLAALTHLTRCHGFSSGSLSRDVGSPVLQDKAAGGFEEMQRWYQKATSEAADYLHQTYGDMEHGIITLSKELFGSDFEPTRDYIETVAFHLKDRQGNWKISSTTLDSGEGGQESQSWEISSDIWEGGVES